MVISLISARTVVATFVNGATLSIIQRACIRNSVNSNVNTAARTLRENTRSLFIGEFTLAKKIIDANIAIRRFEQAVTCKIIDEYTLVKNRIPVMCVASLSVYAAI